MLAQVHDQFGNDVPDADPELLNGFIMFMQDIHRE